MNVRNLVPAPLVSLYHFSWALASAIAFGFPSKRLTIIGVTGTKGKTTVTELVANILETSGLKIAIANGLHFRIGKAETPNLLKMTMPGRWRLQKFLRDAVKSGCNAAILEVTSEGIKQHRHRFINFDVVALTNLHKEHIETHGSFEAYRAAKADLFRRTRHIHILNFDDASRTFFEHFPADKKWYFSLHKNDSQPERTIAPVGYNLTAKGTTFVLEGMQFESPLIGEFNLSNILCAMAISRSLNIEWNAIADGIAAFSGIPGRLEFIQKVPFAVVVDYAHTPDSLEAVYRTMRDTYGAKRLVCVLGSAGGGRDKWKRPVMGEIASRYCDEIILTNEDPYDEEPDRILSEIKSGISNSRFSTSKVHVILDRKEAIQKAIRDAEPDDAVVITGKGGERFMIVDGKKIPWSDTAIAKETLENP